MGVFAPSRNDGRSDSRVIFEMVQHAEPDTTFKYEELIEALQDGLDKTVRRDRVYRAVARANKMLLRERKRYLSVVPDSGYRMISASEHLPVALIRKDKALVQFKRGIELLRNARLDELNDTQRALHEGQLMILSGLYEATKESERRHDQSEALIEELKRRVDKLEKQ